MSQPAPTAAKRRRGLASRIVAGLAAGGLFATLAWADAHRVGGAPPMAWLLPLLLAIAVGAGHEAVRLAAAAGLRLSPRLVPLGAGTIAAAPVLLQFGPAPTHEPFATIGGAAIACMAVVALAFVGGVVRYAAGAGELVRVAGSVAAAIAIGLPLAFIVALRLLPAAAGTANPAAALLPLVSLIAVVKAGDIAAYAVGSVLGRSRLAPVLSPGKTWEGAGASLAASLAVAWLMLEQVAADQAGRPLGGWTTYGLLVGVAGMVGDLAESLVKRDLGAKDSGSVLGGMGGFLDLVDSLLLAGPVAWLLWTLG